MIKYVGILLFLMSNMMFDTLSFAQSTGWSVFYFSMLYFSFAIISFDGFKTEYGRITKKIYLLIVFSFLARGIYELSLLGLPYNEYLLSANSSLSVILFISVFIFVFLIIITKNFDQWLRSIKSIGE